MTRCTRHKPVTMIMLASWLLAAALAGAGFARADGGAAQRAFADGLNELELRSGGMIGAYVLDTGTGREFVHRADERFAMASTFKPLLVAAVLAEVDAGELDLEDAYPVAGVEIQPYSPVVGDLVAGTAISLADLCAAAITLGDNTATNMLLEQVGGPAGLTTFLRRHGDEVTRLDRYEIELNANERGDERDTTTPRAMATALSRVLFDGVLTEASAKRLQGWLVDSRTGAARLRAGLPGQWRVGDKTGTGSNGAVNNVAVAWPPGRQPVIIAVYMSWSAQDATALGALHPEIARLVVKTLD